jgi:hypothetical protein
MGVWLMLLFPFQHRNRSITDIIIQLFNHRRDNPSVFRPRGTLLENPFENFPQKKGIEDQFIRLVKEQFGMKLPIFGNKMLTDQGKHQSGLIIRAKRLGRFTEERKLLFKIIDGTESGTPCILIACILIGGGECAEQVIKQQKKPRIPIPGRKVQVSEQFLHRFRLQHSRFLWGHHFMSILLFLYCSRKSGQGKGSVGAEPYSQG